jgi:DNA-directed RNA polymerase specialized sigma24 family protein
LHKFTARKPYSGYVEDLRHTIALVRRGSAEAADALFARCWPIVWKIAYTVTGRRTLAEDAAQEAITRVFTNIRSFDATRPLEPWVRRIAVNASVDVLRREQRQSFCAEPSRPPGEPGDDGAVAEAVRALTEDKRLVIVLHYWLDCSVEQIARILDVPFGTVAARLSRAREELRVRMEEEHVGA